MLTSYIVAMRSKKKIVPVFNSVAFYVLVEVVPAIFQKVVRISNTLRSAAVVYITY